MISTVDPEQAGFKAGSSCTDHINSVSIIIEQFKEFRSDLHMIFIRIFQSYSYSQKCWNWLRYDKKKKKTSFSSKWSYFRTYGQKYINEDSKKSSSLNVNIFGDMDKKHLFKVIPKNCYFSRYVDIFEKIRKKNIFKVISK